jgi:rhomboid protease GluP
MKTSGRYPATYTIIGITAVIFIFQFLSQQFLGMDYLAYLGSKINSLIMQGQLWRLITPVLLHGSILHIGFNMYALSAIGPGLERKYGLWSFLTLYLVGGLWGNTLSFVMSPKPSLGASTAVFALISAQGVYIYQNRHLLGQSAKPMLMNILMVVAVNLVMGLNPGIDNWGHMGGLFGGLFYAWFAGPTYGIEDGLFGGQVVVKDMKRPLLVALAAIGIAAAMVMAYLLF